MRQAKQVCREMLIGLVIWMLVIGLLLMVIATHRFAALTGVLAGTLVAAGLILHMYRHLDIALDMDAKHARTHTQAAAFQRMFIMAVALALSMLGSRYVHPVGMVLGLFGAKVTALLNPVLHKQLLKRQTAAEKGKEVKQAAEKNKDIIQ